MKYLFFLCILIVFYIFPMKNVKYVLIWIEVVLKSITIRDIKAAFFIYNHVWYNTITLWPMINKQSSYSKIGIWFSFLANKKLWLHLSYCRSKISHLSFYLLNSNLCILYTFDFPYFVIWCDIWHICVFSRFNLHSISDIYIMTNIFSYIRLKHHIERINIINRMIKIYSTYRW